MTSKISTAFFFFLLPLFLFSQKKTLIKFEFPIGVMPGSNFTFRGQPVTIMYPTIYIPLHRHLDIGASYNVQKVNYYVSEQDPVDVSKAKFYSGNIKYKVNSFYFKINLSASQKRVNPFFSYVLSFSKGTYTSPTRDSTSKYVKNSTTIFYGDDFFAYPTRMNANEEEVFKKSIAKSRPSHGLQIGFDYKIQPFLNLFFKASAFSVLGYKEDGLNEQAFSVFYKDDSYSNGKRFYYSPQEYYMIGIILKIDGGKKSLIK